MARASALRARAPCRADPGNAALAAYERAIRLDPRFATAYVNLADLQRQGGDESGAALAVLRSASKRHPQEISLLSALVSISRAQGDRDAALGYARQAAAAWPDNPDISRLVTELEASRVR